MTEQTKRARAEFRQAIDITNIDFQAHTVTIDGIETIHAKKIIVATGSSPKLLGVIGENEFRGRGVSYCATCDAKYYEGKHVVVIGGGNTAIGESLFIAKFASKITIVHQFDKLQANREFQEQAFANPKIKFVFNTEPREFKATDGSVNEVVIENMKTHQKDSIACDGVFVFAGMQPNLDGFATNFKLDPYGYVQISEEMRTNLPNIFAIGDVRSKQFRQMTTAISDGTIAAMVISKELGA
jgi:thioredoxin reductase (NADPH)